MVDVNESSFNDASVWLASLEGAYTGSLNLTNSFAVIIASIDDMTKNIAIANILNSLDELERGDLRVTSCRPEGSVPLIENEKIHTDTFAYDPPIYSMMRLKPDVIILDDSSPFKELTSGSFSCPSLSGHKVFYVVSASGGTFEELKDSAIENYLSFTNNGTLEDIDSVMITEINDLSITEFGVKDSFNVIEYSATRKV